jgi:nucleoporin NUP159
VSSITWLENHVFLLIHTPFNFDGGEVPSSVFHLVTRSPPSSFVFQKISDPAAPFGLHRVPQHHFLLRLRDFPPSLQDVIIVASTASTDIGLLSRSKVPLASGKPAGVFTMTEMADDSRRAQLPMTLDHVDTSPIGLALDLSSKDKVAKPIPGDEMNESPTPLPALMVLNNEGVLASWWIVYSDSIRQGTIYPSLVSARSNPQSLAPSQTSNLINGGLAKPAFGAPSIPAATPTGAFGTTSSIGQRQSPWSTGSNSTTAPINNPAFGSPAFGAAAGGSVTKPAFGGLSFGAPSIPAFGTSGFSGQKASPWGSPGSTATATSFGQTAGLGKPAGVFGSVAATTSAAASNGGFASFASQGGFTAAAKPSSGSIFGAKSTSNVFNTSNTNSGMDVSTNFSGTAPKSGENMGGRFGGESSNFVLGSTFKAADSLQEQAPEPSTAAKDSFFGGTFGNALQEVTKQPPPVSNDAEMDSADTQQAKEPVKPSSTTPSTTPAPLKSSFPPSSPPVSGGLFGAANTASPSSTDKPSVSTKFNFGKPAPGKSNSGDFDLAKSRQSASKNLVADTAIYSTSKHPSSPKIKEEPASSDADIEDPKENIPEPPLPPDPTSKTSYAAGDTSVSSTGTDAPLPPDFITVAAPKLKQLASSALPETTPENKALSEVNPPTDVSGGPEDQGDDDSGFLTEDGDGDESGILSDGDEGSGEEVERITSHTSEGTRTPRFTPQSSFGGVGNRIGGSNLFTDGHTPGQSAKPKSLFGEVGRTAPMLPPPKLQASPRSPSPIRSSVLGRLRPETSRSVSAPGMRSQIRGPQRLSGIASTAAQNSFDTFQEQDNPEEGRRAEAKARKEVEEAQALVDDEDEETQNFLASELAATRTLDDFIAHTDYAGSPSVDSIPAQVETVYRDINSMIDTLGLNARALKCFVKAHTEQYKEQGRNREDLEMDEDWCLVEIEDLSAVVAGTLTRDLESGRVTDVPTKLETCNDLQRDLIRLRAKQEDMKRIVASHADPGQLATTRVRPLSAEQAAQQHDLRREFLKLQNLIAEAEEGLTILKAKITSQPTSNGKSSATVGPTVDAVMRTVTKMTSMAEKRSGDIDVLEGQMRKLRFSSAASTGSQEGSPFTTPQNNRSSLRNPGTSSTYGLFHTPESIRENPRTFQNSLMSSAGSLAQSSPPRKKLSGYTTEEKARLRARLARKKEVTDILRAALQKTGSNIRPMDA